MNYINFMRELPKIMAKRPDYYRYFGEISIKEIYDFYDVLNHKNVKVDKGDFDSWKFYQFFENKPTYCPKEYVCLTTSNMFSKISKELHDGLAMLKGKLLHLNRFETISFGETRLTFVRNKYLETWQGDFLHDGENVATADNVMILLPPKNLTEKTLAYFYGIG